MPTVECHGCGRGIHFTEEEIGKTLVCPACSSGVEAVAGDDDGDDESGDAPGESYDDEQLPVAAPLREAETWYSDLLDRNAQQALWWVNATAMLLVIGAAATLLAGVGLILLVVAGITATVASVYLSRIAIAAAAAIVDGARDLRALRRHLERRKD